MKNANQSSPNEINQPNDLDSYNKSNNSTAKTLVAIAAGAAAGAVTAMLLTPKNGLETRRAISDGAIKIKDGLTDTIKQGIDKLSSKMEQTMAGAKDVAQTASNAANDFSGQMKKGASHVANDISDQIKRG